MITKLCVCLALIATVAAPARDWKVVEPPLVVEFPRDHGVHPEYRTEWWYATGILADKAGDARFGYQLTVFRQGLDPSVIAPGESSLRARHIYAGHLAIVDLARGKMVNAERIRRTVPGLSESKPRDLDVVLDDWTMKRRADGVVVLDALDRDQGLSLALELVPQKPPVMHGQDSVSKKGAEHGNASAYMSWTRLATEGHIAIGGHEFDVRGESWFDHEWGTAQLGAGVIGWDWFGLRLADGRDVMLYRLRRADGSAIAESAGTLVAPDGSSRHLDSADFSLTRDTGPDATWTSPRSKAVYPARWRLRIASAGIDVALRTQTADCEIDGRESTNTVYWEGPVAVEGSVSGSGYGELVGYANSMSGHF